MRAKGFKIYGQFKRRQVQTLEMFELVVAAHNIGNNMHKYLLLIFFLYFLLKISVKKSNLISI